MRLLILLGLCCSGPLLAQPAKAPTPLEKTLTTLIEREQAAAGIPGLSIALVTDKEVRWAKGFGHADRAKKKPATTKTVYRVGSVSKLFTDLAVMQLVEEGKLDLDAPISQYVKDFKPENPFNKKEITLRQLMSHRSGLVREPPLGSYFDPEPPTLAKTIASVNGLPLVYEPGQRIKYSNAAIALVGYIVEVVDGRPFAQSVRERVLKPLGMNESAFEPTPEVHKELAEALMWTYHGREFPAPTFELGEGPAGCMYSTVGDLGRFMQAMFAQGQGVNGRVVKPTTLKEMLTPQFAKPETKSGFGLGFALSELDGQRRVGHGGAIYGFSTELAFLPDAKLGVIVVASKDVTNRITTRLADAALRCLLAEKAGKPLPTFDEPKPLTREEVLRCAGQYRGTGPRDELIAIDEKLYHLGPAGGYLSEVVRVGSEYRTGGILGGGARFTCDGTTLEWLDPGNAATLTRVRQVADKPSPPPVHFTGLIGEYGWDHNVLYIFEKDGQLHALIEWVFLYPLTEESKDVYAFPKEGGLYHGEKLLFTRNGLGKASKVEAARVVFARRTLDGEDGQTFRIKPQKPVADLRADAAKATPPPESGTFLKSDLVELTALDATIKTDLRYASDNNFMGVALYPATAQAYLQRPAAEALKKAHQALAKEGYGLWIFDAYRPWAVTKMFWDATPEKLRTFVADPSKGSRHNRGCAVDLTLYDLKTGKPIEMVSGFDEFSDRAYPNYWGGTTLQRWHRERLRRTMETHGFHVYEAEWWHFDFHDWRKYPIGNQGFDALNKK